MEKKQIYTDLAPAAIGPYSQAIDLGELVFTSGQIPVDPATGAVSDDIVEQAHQSLKNVKAVLEAAGSSMEKVVKTTVFIADMDQFGAINSVYEQYFTQPYPARSCVQAAKLPKGVGIEVEAIALK
jgi:2-iminobutanoate/2-iminopropanoate deaminase